jgi:zinc protease
VKRANFPSLALTLVMVIGFLGDTTIVQLWAQTQQPSQQTWQQIPIPKLPAFHPQQPKRIQLPNGMVIFLQEDHELPMIDGTARIRGGERSVPANKIGLMDVYGEVWRTGGTKSETGDQLDDYLEQRAAKVETGGGGDSTTVSWSCLKEDFDDVFRVFEDLLKNPEFRAEKIEIAQKGMYDGISRRNDEASQIAGREAAKLAYGANSPYARVPEYATVAAITRQDLVEWHGRYVHPNNIILGVVGDFDSAKMEARLREAFASWSRGPAASDPEIKPEPAKPGYYQVDKTDVNQSNIQMVALGIRRDSPDYFATSVFNEAFGGGFSSRLFGDIRTTKGLAYAVGGGVGSGWDHPGMLRMMVSTKSKTTIESIQALDEEMADLPKRPIDEEEIKRAKDAILNSFVFRFDSPEKVLHEQMAYEFYGYAHDFLENFQKQIEKVTKEDVARVAAKYIHREQMAVLVVGNAGEFDKPLSSLGTVTKLDITIPAAPPGLLPAQGEHQ